MNILLGWQRSMAMRDRRIKHHQIMTKGLKKKRQNKEVGGLKWWWRRGNFIIHYTICWVKFQGWKVSPELQQLQPRRHCEPNLEAFWWWERENANSTYILHSVVAGIQPPAFLLWGISANHYASVPKTLTYKIIIYYLSLSTPLNKIKYLLISRYI